MGEPAIIRIQFDGFDRDKPVTFNAQDWWVHETNGVQLLTIQDKESTETTHEIPLASVLYWSVVPGNDIDLNVPNDRYCDTCKTYFPSGSYHEHPFPTHDVRRVCCGTSPQGKHHPACTARRTSTGEPRIGEIVRIDDDIDGLRITAKLDNDFTSNIKRFFRNEPEPDPNQPGVG